MVFQKLYLICKKPILLADSTSIVITNSDISEFKKNINNVFIKIKKLVEKYFIITEF